MKSDLDKTIYLSIDITTNTLKISHNILKYYEQKNKSQCNELPYTDDLNNLKGYMVYDFEIATSSIDKLLVDFISSNFNDFSEYLIFFTKYVSYLSKDLDFEETLHILPNQHLDTEYIMDLAKKTYQLNKEKIINSQNDFIKAIEFIFNINNENKLKNLSPKQRYFLYERFGKTLDNYSTDFSTNKILGFTYDNPNINNCTTLNDTLKSIKKYDPNGDNINSSNVYSTDDIFTMFYILLYHIVLQNNLIIKKCKNCNKYFATTKINIVYCDRLFENNKTCRDIGNSLSQKRKEQDNYVYKKYRNLYAKKAMMVKRNPDIKLYKTNYEKWKKDAKEFVNDINTDKKTYKEFDEWLEEK